MPNAIQITIATTPNTVEISIGVLRRYTQKPNAIATTINNKDTIATVALDALAALSRTPSTYVAPKVDATIEAKAATTRINVRYAKIINNLLARLLILVEMISPIDCPL